MLQYTVATAYLAAPLGYWGYSIYMGQPVDMLVWVLVVSLTLASAYLVFGRERVEGALDEARDLTGQSEDEE